MMLVHLLPLIMVVGHFTSQNGMIFAQAYLQSKHQIYKFGMAAHGTIIRQEMVALPCHQVCIAQTGITLGLINIITGGLIESS